MSIEDLTAFFAKLESDQALQDQALALQGARGEERLAGLTSLAAEHGFTVTAADWEHEAAGPAIAALEDEKLRDVAGGGCGDAVGLIQAQGGSLGAAEGSCGCREAAGAYSARGQSLGLGAGGCG